ncbi:MAG: hypothetical protein J7480_00630 [Microbacteriaceae bacterium]|nr:hypothetical protein [Microbacteriaceae bacterium]
MRAIWVRLAIAGGVLVVGFVAAVAILNQTVYTPAQFVRGYLDALQRHDVATALALAGPSPASSARDDLLNEEILGQFDIVEVTESGDEDGVHTVAVDYESAGRTGRTSFQVEQGGAVLGMFPTWRFASSPLAELDLTVEHARDFTANGIRFVAPVQDVPSTYLAFTPGVLTLGHDSAFQHAAPQTIVLGTPRTERTVSIDAQANEAFVAQVDKQVHAYLDECAKQPRLFPTGCPFGHSISDPRLASDPAWSIPVYPAVTVQPTTTPGEWTVPVAPGVARLQVDIVDTYDGSVYAFDTTVDFSLGFVVTFVGATEVVLTPVLG